MCSFNNKGVGTTPSEFFKLFFSECVIGYMASCLKLNHQHWAVLEACCAPIPESETNIFEKETADLFLFDQKHTYSLNSAAPLNHKVFKHCIHFYSFHLFSQLISLSFARYSTALVDLYTSPLLCHLFSLTAFSLA